jgi:hypothetical protein
MEGLLGEVCSPARSAPHPRKEERGRREWPRPLSPTSFFFQLWHTGKPGKRGKRPSPATSIQAGKLISKRQGESGGSANCPRGSAARTTIAFASLLGRGLKRALP